MQQPVFASTYLSPALLAVLLFISASSLFATTAASTPVSEPDEEQIETWKALLQRNFREQPVAALITVQGLNNEKIDQGNGGSYITWQLRCTVLDTYKGELEEVISLPWTVEWLDGDEKPAPPPVGTTLIVSLDYYEDGNGTRQYRLPDVAYDLPDLPELIETARNFRVTSGSGTDEKESATLLSR